MKDSQPAYATLSHCWGKLNNIKLQKDNLDAFGSQIPWYSMSKVFQDVIILARKLGIHYLWIDALCIIQDSIQDWTHEANLMQSIYVNSYINISATAPEDGNAGLFRERDATCIKSVSIRTDPTQNDIGRLIYSHDTWDDTVASAPVNQRAWVIQERFLAPRVVHFSKDQVHWECMSLMTSEGLPDRFESPHQSSGRIKLPKIDLSTRSKRESLHSSIFDIWDKLVERYTEAKLTFISDRSVAINGISQAIQHCLDYKPTDYFFGLWKPRFLDGLMWFTHGGTHKRIPGNKAPSWSWLSIDGEIRSQHYSGKTNSILRTQLLEVIGGSEDGANGSSSSGHIRLRGPMYKAVFAKSRDTLLLQVGEDRFDGNLPERIRR